MVKIVSMISSVWLTVLCVATVYGLLMAFALFSSVRGNRRANYYLGSFIILLSGSIVLHAFHYWGLTQSYPHLYLLYTPIGFLLGPLLYFHIGSLTDPAGPWQIQKFFGKHSVPFILFTLYLFPCYFRPAGYKLEILDKGYLYFAHDFIVYDLAQNLSLMGYLAFAFRLSLNFSKVRVDTDFLHVAILRWSLMLTFYVTLAMIFVFIQALGVNLLQIWLVPMICVGFFGLTGYIWFLVPEIFISTLKISPKKYQRSGLKEEDARRFAEKLVCAMESEHYYSKPNISLKALASSMGVNQVYLSQIINEKFGKSFFDFINSYRIQEAMQRLDSGEEVSILDIAYDVGFNSKSTFYAAFKKVTSITPGEYLERGQERSKKPN